MSKFPYFNFKMINQMIHECLWNMPEINLRMKTPQANILTLALVGIYLEIEKTNINNFRNYLNVKKL